MLVTDVKTENFTKFFLMTDESFGDSMQTYANVINTIWGRIYACEQFGLRHTPTLYHLFFILQK